MVQVDVFLPEIVEDFHQILIGVVWNAFENG